MTGSHRRPGREGAGIALGLLILAAAAQSPADTYEPSPAAVLPGGKNASEYWDLTIETESGYRVLARFIITNEGPSSQNGIAVGHVVAPDGQTRKFNNGRLKKRWNLSEDGLEIDIGRSKLSLEDDRARLVISKSDVVLDLSFPLNARRTIPPDVSGSRYRIDLLALGASTSGTIQLKGMTSAIDVRGHGWLTHTISPKKEAVVALRRIEVMGSSESAFLYLIDFLAKGGAKSHWLAYLERGCELDGKTPGSSCASDLSSTRAFELVLNSGSGSKKSRKKSKSYWIPNTLSLTGDAVQGRIQWGPKFLRHDPLDDLPGPIRFLASFSSAPRREWSESSIQVTIPAKSESTFIQFQGKGVGSISFLNPVTHPRVR